MYKIYEITGTKDQTPKTRFVGITNSTALELNTNEKIAHKFGFDTVTSFKYTGRKI